MNILIIINVRWFNATAFYALNLARILKKNNNKVYIVCNSKWPPYKIAKKLNLPVIGLNFYGYNLFRLLKNLKYLIRFIKENNIEIINAHRSEDQTFGALASFFTKKRFILTRGDRRKIKSNFLNRIKYYKAASHIVLTSKSIYENNKKFLAPIKDKVSIIYGSIDEDNFKVTKSKKETKNKYKIPANKIIIGMAGRYDIVKDQYTFMKAALHLLQYHKNIHFILAGKEEEIKIKILKKMSENYKKYFTFLKLIPDIADVINIFDIGVITSIASETITRVGFEYMYLGKPIIGTKVNAIKEIIRNKKNGFLITPGDYKQLSFYLSTLIKNKQLLKNMGEESKRLYKKLYSENIFYEKSIKIFKEAK